MAGVNKRRTSPASTSSSSGDGMPRRITRKPRSIRRGPRGAARRPPAPRLVNALDLNTSALDPDKELRNSDVSQLGRIVLPKVIGAKKAGYEHTATVPQIHEHMDISATLAAPQLFHDYAAPVAPEADDILAMVPQADEIFDGILNSLPEIPVANVRYSDFFDPFGDTMDMTNPLGSNHSVNLATHFHDEKPGSSSFPYPKSGPLM
ncbi:B3 domain-containing protein LFL1 [Dichanthelium oligosanthes]|uniref:B3 domain-containing protein LFL1 n=1 Tax=Dichanthelium oligosanthes TaxID=888268 RepID=A0A1E5WKZ6_9POAL|nr:B3 domain-containing protein LFL1 [Dichanthelium oligosanthes]